ncbi:Retrovirus-related Pol polyprotein from transposon 412 family [Gossypium australe]|uniref:Retrovirus-related Pol polyprotein from transposon 412 family n=1 Tax=Gossypium australe TaxID=47621 RepID=A0A5B6V9T3_9ROSI|nr:Retrovirus-related Pol polyprotein from transposon 412 family [Gossypium australe]
MMLSNAYEFCQACDRYQRTGNLLRRYEMPLQTILEVELFDIWGIDFMGPFPPSWGNLLIVSKWVEAVALPTNDAKSVLTFLHKNIFTRFGTPHTLISDEGFNCDCKLVANALNRYRVKHKIVTAYHPQTNGQAKVFNREIK